MDLIIFNATKEGEPCLCFKKGLLGCTKIESIYQGLDDGNIPIYSNEVSFEHKETIVVNNPILVSD